MECSVIKLTGVNKNSTAILFLKFNPSDDLTVISPDRLNPFGAIFFKLKGYSMKPYWDEFFLDFKRLEVSTNCTI